MESRESAASRGWYEGRSQGVEWWAESLICARVAGEAGIGGEVDRRDEAGSTRGERSLVQDSTLSRTQGVNTCL